MRRKKRQKDKKIVCKSLDIDKTLMYNVTVSIYYWCESMINDPRGKAEGGNIMSQIKVKENESLDSALRRFKRQTSRDGIIQEVRKREHYEKPSVARKKKSEAARKRKFK